MTQKTAFASWDVPTASEIDSVCLSYRHDFGLLSPTDQSLTRFQAVEWLHAWRKELNK